SPYQVGGLVHEVKSSPTGQLREGVRETLTQGVVAGGKQGYPEARRQVERLERSAVTLPNQLSIYGMVSPPPATPSTATTAPNIEPKITVNPSVSVSVNAPDSAAESYERAAQKQSAMGGSGSVLGSGG